MTRDELLAAGARAWHVDSWKIDGDAVAAIIDAVEPLIRADERERFDATVKWVREDERATAQAQMADLRAKVLALPSAYIVAGVWVDARPSDDDEWGDKPAVLRADVLALLDGATDE